MKVSEAKEKVCPFMNGFSYYSDGTLHTNQVVRCICGDCMAWVYTRTHSETLTERYVVTHSPDSNGNTNTIHTKPSEIPEDSKEGYCSRISNGL